MMQFRTVGIQQLRGPIFIQFWSLNPFEWTKMDILHTSYHLSRDTHGLSTDPLLLFSYPRSYWMTCATARLQRDDLIRHWNPQIQYFLLPSDKHVINMTTVMKFHSAESKRYHGYF